MTHARLMFPHPVLRAGGIDYTKEYQFNTEVSVQDQNHRIRLSIKYMLASNFLTDLITDGSAKYLVMVKCSRTGQRRALKSVQSAVEWNLDGNDFRGSLLLSTYVVAERNIEPFESDEHHQEMRGVATRVPTGAILAMGNQYEIRLDTIEGDMGAIIQLIHNDQVESGMYYIGLNNKLIEIIMDRETFEATKRIKAEFPNILLPMLYVPAIENAIRNLKDNGDKLWAEAINGALEKHGIECNENGDYDNPNEIAQRLMNYPYKHAFDIINKEDESSD